MWIRSHSFLRKALWVIGIVAVAAVLLLNIIWLSEISYDAKEKVTISVSVLPSMGLFLLLGVLVLLLYGKHSEGWEVFFLYFIGGLIFHTFWEAKSQYTYPYAFCLIPFAMYAAAMLLRKIRTVQKREKQG